VQSPSQYTGYNYYYSYIHPTTGQSPHLELVDTLCLDRRHDVVKIFDRIVKREKRENLKVGSSRRRCRIGVIRHREATIPEVKRIERNPAKPFEISFLKNVLNQSNAGSTATIHVDIGYDI